MKQKSKRSRRLIVVLIVALITLCVGIPLILIIANAVSPVAVIEEEERIAAGGAQSAAVAIEMPSGMLELGSGDASLLDAAFRYGEAQPQPEVRYDVANGQGTIHVRQAAQDAFTLRRAPNEWRLRLNRNVPLSLNVEAGNGLHSLDLRGLSISEAKIALHDNSVATVNAGGYWQEEVNVEIQGGSGLLTVVLPQGMGARVLLDGVEGEVKSQGLVQQGSEGQQIYANDLHGKTKGTVNVHVTNHRGEISLVAGVPGDMPIAEAIKLARLIYSRQGTFDCSAVPDDHRYLPTDSVRDLWYDYLCERGPQVRHFDGSAGLTRELAQAEMIDRIRREFYRMDGDVISDTMKFNTEEFVSATLDMLLKARMNPETIEFSLTHFMGSFTYSVRREADRVRFTVANQTDLASGTHLPLRFPDAGYTQSLETLLAQEPQLEDAFLLEVVQSNRYPIISILEAKTREETRDAVAEGGGNFEQTFTWTEPYLAEFEALPPWPGYLQQLDIR